MNLGELIQNSTKKVNPESLKASSFSTANQRRSSYRFDQLLEKGILNLSGGADLKNPLLKNQASFPKSNIQNQNQIKFQVSNFGENSNDASQRSGKKNNPTTVTEQTSQESLSILDLSQNNQANLNISKINQELKKSATTESNQQQNQSKAEKRRQSLPLESQSPHLPTAPKLKQIQTPKDEDKLPPIKISNSSKHSNYFSNPNSSQQSQIQSIESFHFEKVSQESKIIYESSGSQLQLQNFYKQVDDNQQQIKNLQKNVKKVKKQVQVQNKSLKDIKQQLEIFIALNKQFLQKSPKITSLQKPSNLLFGSQQRKKFNIQSELGSQETFCYSEEENEEDSRPEEAHFFQLT